VHNPCVSSQLQQRPGLLAPRALAGGWRGAEARVMWAAMACWYSAAQQRMLFRGLVLGALLLRSFSRLHSSQHVCTVRSSSAPSTSPRRSGPLLRQNTGRPWRPT